MKQEDHVKVFQVHAVDSWATQAERASLTFAAGGANVQDEESAQSVLTGFVRRPKS